MAGGCSRTGCIVSAPLVLGLDLTDAKLAPILDVIGNKAAIAVNQAWVGHVQHVVLVSDSWQAFEGSCAIQ